MPAWQSGQPKQQHAFAYQFQGRRGPKSPGRRVILLKWQHSSLWEENIWANQTIEENTGAIIVGHKGNKLASGTRIIWTAEPQTKDLSPPSGISSRLTEDIHLSIVPMIPF